MLKMYLFQQPDLYSCTGYRDKETNHIGERQTSLDIFFIAIIEILGVTTVAEIKARLEETTLVSRQADELTRTVYRFPCTQTQ